MSMQVNSALGYMHIFSQSLANNGCPMTSSILKCLQSLLKSASALYGISCCSFEDVCQKAGGGVSRRQTLKRDVDVGDCPKIQVGYMMLPSLSPPQLWFRHSRTVSLKDYAWLHAAHVVPVDVDHEHSDHSHGDAHSRGRPQRT